MLPSTQSGEFGPEQKNTVRLYAALGAGLLLSLLPFMIAAAISMVLVVGVLIAAYMIRAGADNQSLAYNHTTFIIRTIWIGSGLAAVTIGLGGLYLYYTIDNTPLDPCIQNVLNAGAQLADMQDMMAVMNACYDSYVQANLTTFIVSGTLAAGPVLIYFLVRYARGLNRAINGYRIANPTSLF